MSEHVDRTRPVEPGQSPTDDPRDAEPGDQDPVPEADDGTVPAKQIHRWKGEGGSLHPND